MKATKVYNISSLPGTAVIFTNKDGSNDDEIAEFAAGEMPLSYDNWIKGTDTGGTMETWNRASKIVFLQRINAGQHVQVYLKFPVCTIEYASLTAVKHNLQLHCRDDDGNIVKSANYTGALDISSNNGLFMDDFEFTMDEGATDYDLMVAGTLAHDLTEVIYDPTLEYENNKGYPEGNQNVTFSSYNDFRIVVESVGGINPAALMQGYMVGQAIRRARG